MNAPPDDDALHAGLLSGEVVGDKYRIDREIGSGGMGCVYLAENTWTGRRVALKVLRAHFTFHGPAVRRFLQEARSAARLEHPHIVDVLDAGRDPQRGWIYIVQQFLHGSDLRSRLAGKRLSVPEALDIVLPVLAALAAAHDLGIIHRDIKPENIFLADRGDGVLRPVLIDFGISKIAHDKSGGDLRTHTGAIVGTPAFMSPEQARGEATLDARSDLWSLGAVLYEMLSGRPAFDGESVHVIVSKIVTQPATPIRDVCPGIAPELAAIIHRALAQAPADRYPDARAMALDLMAFADASSDDDIRAAGLRQRDALARWFSVSGAADAMPAESHGPRRAVPRGTTSDGLALAATELAGVRRRSGQRRAWIAASGAAVALAIGAWVTWSGSSTGASTTAGGTSRASRAPVAAEVPRVDSSVSVAAIVHDAPTTALQVVPGPDVADASDVSSTIHTTTAATSHRTTAPTDGTVLSAGRQPGSRATNRTAGNSAATRDRGATDRPTGVPRPDAGGRRPYSID